MDDNYSAASGQGIYAGRFSNTPLTDFIAAMPSNSWAEYTGTNINATDTARFDGEPMSILESDANYPLTNWANKFAWDSANRRISGVGTSQGFTIPGGERYAKQVVFDLVSNQFAARWNPTGQKQGHVYDGNCSGFVNGKSYRKANNETEIWAYDSALDSWSQAYSVAGLPSINTLWSIDCNAAHNALYCLEQLTGRLVKFDLTSGSRSVIGSHAGVGAYPLLLSIGNYIVFGAGDASTKLYKMDTSGVVTLVSESLPVPYDCRGNYRFLPHPTDSAKAICISQSDLKIRTLDIMTGVFADYGTLPSEPQMSASVSASLIGLGAVATWRGTGRTGGATQSKFWIYKV